jgi:hypothetical protein
MCTPLKLIIHLYKLDCKGPRLNGPNGLHIYNVKSRLIVTSLRDMSKNGGDIEVVDLKNKTISSLRKGETTSHFGFGLEFDSTEARSYITNYHIKDL